MNPASVLHISFGDNDGGAGRAAYKIHASLRQTGLTSRMLVRRRETADPDVGLIHGDRRYVKWGDAIGRNLVDLLSLQYLYYPSAFALAKHPWFQAANVVQLYNLHSGFFTIRALPHLSQLKPLVWRLSDMWALTGHCSYAYECDRWKTGCGCCPHLTEYPALRYDTTALLWRVKQQAYQHSRLTIVATNTWMEQQVRQSPLLGQFPVHRIPNGVNTETFRPIPKRLAREVLGIPATAKVVLFAAFKTKEPRKGSQFVSEVMQRLATSGMENLVLLVMGGEAESWVGAAGYQTRSFNLTQDERFLAIVYAAADVFLHPALVENFPNTVLESMACGTPSVAFQVGGVPDIVRSWETGYLARYGDGADLAVGVRRLLEDETLRTTMSDRCRHLIETEYSLPIQAQRYLQLYEHLHD